MENSGGNSATLIAYVDGTKRQVLINTETNAQGKRKIESNASFWSETIRGRHGRREGMSEKGRM